MKGKHVVDVNDARDVKKRLEDVRTGGTGGTLRTLTLRMDTEDGEDARKVSRLAPAAGNHGFSGHPVPQLGHPGRSLASAVRWISPAFTQSS